MTCLHLADDARGAMIAHAVRARPSESCGLLVGRGRVATTYLPLDNVAEDPTRRFLSSPTSTLVAYKWMRTEGWDLVAVSHSHPTTLAIPSRIDRAEHLDHSTPCVIVSLLGDTPEIRAWDLSTGAEWEIVSSSLPGEGPNSPAISPRCVGEVAS